MEQTGFFGLGKATSLEERNSEFEQVKLRLKIDLVSYPTRVEGLGKYVQRCRYILLITKV